MAHFRGSIHSTVLDMKTQIQVVFPKNVLEMNDAKVVYLLHGLSDNAEDWFKNTQLTLLAEDYNVIFIMPEVQRSFYADMAYGLKYFTYVSEELPKICQKLFGVSAKREDVYVMGLSMGGYGALKCALKKPEQYAGCAAFSAAADIERILERSLDPELSPPSMKQEMQATFGMNFELVKENDLFPMVMDLEKEAVKPRIFMTCGTEDFIYDCSVKFREFMKPLSFDFTYQEWSGVHEWYLWNKSLHLACQHFFDLVTEEDHCNVE